MTQVEIEAQITKLRSKEEKAEEEAAAQLGKLGTKVIPALIASFQGGDFEWPGALKEAFEKIGRVAVPYLVRALESNDRTTRLVATRLLWDFEEDAAPAISTFVGRLADPDSKMRWLCAQGFGRIGPLARNALPALLVSVR